MYVYSSYGLPCVYVHACVCVCDIITKSFLFTETQKQT